ncbi:NADH-quinone oxidoreductase subunit 11 [bacterium HR24]|jgi:NADH:ubiquinone oxidoreductase subunit K|nr:NADH-quinone oxidoreductase subunit 11 [bacterium HR24]
MSVGLEHFLVLSALLFGVGLFMALAKRNIVGILMGIELMFNAVNLSLVAFARFLEAAERLSGQVFVVFSITVAAAEAAVALALAVAIYRRRESVDVDRINLLRW